MNVPSRAEHLATSAANEALAARLADQAEYGWSITCLFYAALHLVEAYLQQNGEASANHGQRNMHLRREAGLDTVHRRYNVLKRESENARYRCRIFSANETAHMRELIYTPLASYMRNLLGVN